MESFFKLIFASCLPHKHDSEDFDENLVSYDDTPQKPKTIGIDMIEDTKKVLQLERRVSNCSTNLEDFDGSYELEDSELEEEEELDRGPVVMEVIFCHPNVTIVDAGIEDSVSWDDDDDFSRADDRMQEQELIWPSVKRLILKYELLKF